MKNNLFYLLLCLVICSSSCTSLKVKVSVIDKKKLKELPGFLDLTVGATEQSVATKMNTDFYNEQRATLKEVVSRAAQTIVDNGDITAIEKTSMESETFAFIDQCIENAQTQHREGLQLMEKAREKIKDKEEFKKNLVEANIRFSTGKGFLMDLASKINSDFGKDGLLANANNQEKKDQLQITNSLVSDASILNDPLVSLIANTARKKKYWKGVFNKTKVNNGFGNSDIAITMESLGNFTIKGVRLDASTVVAASFKTLSQSLQFLSAIYGVPINGANEEAEAKPEENSLDHQYINIEAKENELAFRKKFSNLATIAILDGILSRKADLRNPANFQAALKAIKSTYSVYKPQLKTKSNE